MEVLKTLTRANMKSQKLRLSLQKYRHFAIIKPVTEPCHVQHRGIQSGKDTLFLSGNSIRRNRLPESTAGDIRSRFEKKKVYPKQFLPLH